MGGSHQIGSASLRASAAAGGHLRVLPPGCRVGQIVGPFPVVVVVVEAVDAPDAVAAAEPLDQSGVLA
jgi:hypothetical protein